MVMVFDGRVLRVTMLRREGLGSIATNLSREALGLGLYREHGFRAAR